MERNDTETARQSQRDTAALGSSIVQPTVAPAGNDRGRSAMETPRPLGTVHFEGTNDLRNLPATSASLVVVLAM